jgi:hypothetical protein
MQNKTYLGDGVYAAYDGWMVALTTENGYEATNTVYLEPSVLEALQKYVEQLKVMQSSGV